MQGLILIKMKKTAYIVLWSAVLFNLFSGIVYAWSVLKSQIMLDWGWSAVQAGLPYTMAIVFTAVGVPIGGIIQDKIGPRPVATAGAFLMGLGIVIAGIIGNSLIGIIIWFGIIAGIGMGLSGSALNPPAMKWFPDKKGLVNGLILGAFSLSAIIFAPMTSQFLKIYSIENTLIWLGIIIGILGLVFSQFLKNPPDYPIIKENNFSLLEMLKTSKFYLIFLMFLLSLSVGLMLISSIIKISQLQIGLSDPIQLSLIVAFLAFCNTTGRIGGGLLSDNIGKINTLRIVFGLQSINMLLFIFYSNIWTLSLGILIAGFCFGTIICMLPTIPAELFGLKNIGINFGIMFMAWGLAGTIAPLFTDILFDISGTFNRAYLICAGITIIPLIISFILNKDKLNLGA
jgi:OFA family oxalate/formate antiporter-like MFS transporter